MVYARSSMGRHLIYFKGRFNRPVEPGDFKNNGNELTWTEQGPTTPKLGFPRLPRVARSGHASTLTAPPLMTPNTALGLSIRLSMFELRETGDWELFRRSGSGGVGGEEKLGYQEEEEGSRKFRKIGVRGGPIEGEWNEGEKTTLILHGLIMQLVIAQQSIATMIVMIQQLPCPLSLLESYFNCCGN